MCGVIGYVGKQPAVPILIDGLRRLEYRGYDSAGVAFLEHGVLEVRRAVGKLANLEHVIGSSRYAATIGLGHTRWATHGRPSEENAHPHRAGRVVLIHNGIIENYLPLRRELAAAGRTFRSETDTEIIAHLIDRGLEQGQSFEAAFRGALSRLKGAYAVVAMAESEPGVLMAARYGCPLIVGVGEGEQFIASDVPAILAHTRSVMFLEDGDVIVASAGRVEISDLEGRPRERRPVAISWSPAMAEKGGFKHFMLKEIFEQPQALINTIQGRLSHETGAVYLEELGVPAEALRQTAKVTITACGTSWHAGLVGKFLIERLARVPVEVDIASEYRYRDPIVSPTDLVVAISQSGETADTLGALREAKARGGRTLAVCNVVGSTIAREADGVLYTHAGPEIGVASTKAFVCQLAAMVLLALALGQARGRLDAATQKRYADALFQLPAQFEDWLRRAAKSVGEIARGFAARDDFLYLGRGPHYPIALEGALKLKEISYIHAEGYPAGEMKHGPIALIDEGLPVVMLAMRDASYDKILNAVMEVKARGGAVIAVVTEGDEDASAKADAVIGIPELDALVMPIMAVVPLQLLAYHIAVLRGSDVDQPRNLAKSVTVE
ncbi:MAG: glutamine--fructose-6-phosphate transaminase (isomerizing) [Nitrospirota bacterium]